MFEREAEGWDIAEIVYTYTQAGRAHLWAKASGPDGIYCAGETPDFPCAPWPIARDGAATAAYRDLMIQLLDDGWDFITDATGPYWFSVRLARPAAWREMDEARYDDQTRIDDA